MSCIRQGAAAWRELIKEFVGPRCWVDLAAEVLMCRRYGASVEIPGLGRPRPGLGWRELSWLSGGGIGGRGYERLAA